MSSSAALWAAILLIFLLNLPFGFWRAGVRRYSPPWFLAVHAPVPLVIGLRVMLGVGWRVRLLPLFLAAYFVGQYLGGRGRILDWARSKGPDDSGSKGGRVSST